ncbi:hypothetical protein CL629_01355 [bacterium]|nr:hypothetical protein [bacterium]
MTKLPIVLVLAMAALIIGCSTHRVTAEGRVLVDVDDQLTQALSRLLTDVNVSTTVSPSGGLERFLANPHIETLATVSTSKELAQFLKEPRIEVSVTMSLDEGLERLLEKLSAVGTRLEGLQAKLHALTNAAAEMNEE